VLVLVLESSSGINRVFSPPVHKILNFGVYPGGMTSNLQFGPACRMLVLGLLAAVLVWMGWDRPEKSARVRLRTVDNNPNRFRLWGNSNSYSYTFTYDPHAADVWLFESAGGYR